jgi:DNA-binding LacI/PurR family transcriptional regulator
MSGEVQPPVKAANIFDVARLAGVSHQTVSRVLNDLPNVRPATRERVERAITQLRYVPSPAARALVSRRSRTLGLIVTGLPGYGPSSIALGFHSAARDARYSVSMSSVGEADATALRTTAEQLVRQNVEAIVIVGSRHEATRTLRDLELGLPLVAVSPQREEGMHRVSMDQYQGARIAVDHLIDLGHREIAHLAGPDDSSDAAERRRGWRDTLTERGLRVTEPVVGDWSAASGFGAARTLVATGATGVFAANDLMALGVMRGLVVAGRVVPDEVSVVGFDDIPETAYYSPPLTTVRQDFDSLGREALAAVLAVLRDEVDGEAVRRIPGLVVRESTAPPAS